MYILQKIEESCVKNIDSRKFIGEFLLDEKENISKYSMQQIADKTFTSKSTLFRYAQNLGYSGWKEFIQLFLEEIHFNEMHYSNIDPNLPFLPEDDTKLIIEKLTKIQIGSLEETANNVCIASLNTAADYIISARKYVVVFGINSNDILGGILRRKLESIGILINIASTDESGTISAALKEGDCAIIISYSGNNENREPLKYINLMKQNNVNIIGITSGGNNYLRQNIDCILTISSREKLYSKISNFTTEESIIHILNLVYSCCFLKNYNRNYYYKLNNSKKLEYRKNASLINMKEK